jgi:iron complex outermembrane receptor protein
VANADDGGIETVFVTARHRSEDAQKVPISLTVVDAAALDTNGITSSEKLDELIPSLQVLSFNPRNTSILVRGLGSNVAIANDGLEAGVGVYVDGVLYSRQAESVFDLPDISTIEELRGPQGTLFGKNAVAGAINITTQAPTQDFEARASFSYGNYGYTKETATVSGPLSDTLAYRLIAYNTDRGGFDYDVTTHEQYDDYHDYGFRGQLLFQPTDDLSIRVIADYGHQTSRQAVEFFDGVVTTLSNGLAVPNNFYQQTARAGYTPLPVDPFARRTDANAPIFIKMEQGGLSVQADYTFNGFTLTSISAGRFWNWDPSNDQDYTALSVFNQGRTADQEKQFSQELRITSPTGGVVDYTGGLYYFSEEDDGYSNVEFGKDAPLWFIQFTNPTFQTALDGLNYGWKTVPRTSSYAGYGQATWHISPDFDFTGGFRYTYERKTGGFNQSVISAPDLSSLSPGNQALASLIRTAFGAVPESYALHVSNSLLGGLATADWHVSDNVNAYATYSHGEKSAGLNLTNLPAAVPKVVAPEDVDNYEIGLKSEWFDNRLVFNADVFWENDTNYQTTDVYIVSATQGNLFIANIPSVRSRGVESDIQANPLDELSLRFSAAYTDATALKYPNAPAPFEDFYSLAAPTVFDSSATRDLSGRPLSAVSKWVISAGGEYHQSLGDLGLPGLTGYAGADTSYRSRYYSGVDLSIYSIVPGHDITNFHLGVRSDDGRWDFSLWARNAFNTNYFLTRSVSGNDGAITALVGDPRTVGATLQLAF